MQRLRRGTLSRAIRVGYCIDSFDIGGTELNAVRTVEALDRRRFQVTVFHLHETGPLRARYEALGLQLLHLPIGPALFTAHGSQGVRFLRLLRREGIEVVHTHDLYTNIFAAPWARLAGCRVIASRRWLDATPRAVSCHSIVGAIVSRTAWSPTAPGRHD